MRWKIKINRTRRRRRTVDEEHPPVFRHSRNREKPVKRQGLSSRKKGDLSFFLFSRFLLLLLVFFSSLSLLFLSSLSFHHKLSLSHFILTLMNSTDKTFTQQPFSLSSSLLVSRDKPCLADALEELDHLPKQTPYSSPSISFSLS